MGGCWVPERLYEDVGLDAHKVHDVEGVQGLVPRVHFLLEHDGRISIELVRIVGKAMMAGGDGREVSGEGTVLHDDEVLDHVLGGVGTKDLVKGSELPILFLDVVQGVFELLCAELFIQCFGTKEVDLEEGLQDFALGHACLEVFRAKCRPFREGDVVEDVIERQGRLGVGDSDGLQLRTEFLVREAGGELEHGVLLPALMDDPLAVFGCMYDLPAHAWALVRREECDAGEERPHAARTLVEEVEGGGVGV